MEGASFVAVKKHMQEIHKKDQESIFNIKVYSNFCKYMRFCTVLCILD